MDEDLFLKFVTKLSVWPAPIWFRKLIFRSNRKETTIWIQERGLEEREIIDASWAIFIISLASESAILPLLVLEVGFLPALIWPLLPIIISSLFVNMPYSYYQLEEKKMSKEAPQVVSCLTMSMQTNPSLETGIIFTVENNSGVLSDKLRKLLWEVLTRRKSDIFSAILDFSARLSEINEGLKQSLYLVASAAYEHTKEGFERVVDKANQLVLDGIRKRVEEYTASLSAPTMMLFSLGIILPVMLFALLPLLTITPSSGIEFGSSPGTDAEILAIPLLVFFPFTSYLYARSILQRSPLRTGENVMPEKLPAILCCTFLSSLAAFTVHLYYSGEYKEYIVLSLIAFPISMVFYALTRKSTTSSAGKKDIEKDFVHALYQIGNRMLTGLGFEKAFEETVSSMRGTVFSSCAEKIIYHSKISSRSLSSLIGIGDFLPVRSSILKAALPIVIECSYKDPQAAGKVALNLAQNIADIKKSEREIRDKLRTIIDMMKHTVFYFAPIVMGVTAGLMGALNAYLTDYQSNEPVILIAGLYLVELSFVINYFASSLYGVTDWNEICYRFAVSTPVAIAIFMITSLICAQGMIAFV